MGKADIQSKRNYQLIVGKQGKAATETPWPLEPASLPCLPNDRPTLRSTGSLAPAHALSAHFTFCTHWRLGLLGISVAKVVRSINISTQSAVSSHSHTVSHSHALSFSGARAIPFSSSLPLTLSFPSLLLLPFSACFVEAVCTVWARVLSDLP